MLGDIMKAKVAAHLTKLRDNVTLTATLGADDNSTTLARLLSELSSLSDKIVLKLDGQNGRRPCVSVSSALTPEHGIEFAGLPLGKQFSSLVLALLWAGGHPPKVADETLEKVRNLSRPLRFEVYYSLECHYCAETVQSLALMSLVNPLVSAAFIQGSAFPSEMNERSIEGFPAAFLNGEWFSNGSMAVEDVVAILTGAAEPPKREANLGPTPVMTMLGSNPARPEVGIFPATEALQEQTIDMFHRSLPLGASLVVVDESGAGPESGEPIWWQGIVSTLEVAGFVYKPDESDFRDALPEVIAQALDRMLRSKSGRTLKFARAGAKPTQPRETIFDS